MSSDELKAMFLGGYASCLVMFVCCVATLAILVVIALTNFPDSIPSFVDFFLQNLTEDFIFTTTASTLCLSGIAGVGTFGYLIERQEKTKAIELPEDEVPSSKVFTLLLGKPEKWDSQKARVLMSGLLEVADGNGVINFYINATYEAIQLAVEYTVGYPTLEVVDSILKSTYPDMEAKEELLNHVPIPYLNAYHVFTPSTNYPFIETMTSTQLRQDPLKLLVLAMDTLQSGESLNFCVSVVDSVNFNESQRQDLLMMSRLERGDRPRMSYKQPFIHSAIDVFFQTLEYKNSFVPRYTTGDTRRFEHKLAQTNYATRLFMWIDTPHRERIDWFHSLTTRVKELATSTPMIMQGRTVLGQMYSQEQLISSELWYVINNKPYPNKNTYDLFVATLDELASLWHVPHDQFTAKKLQWKVNAPLPEELKNTDGVLVGYSGRDAVRFPRTDSFKTEHMAIFGRTGMGKSTLMQTLIRDDIRHNRGAVVIDPKGDLVRDILRYSIPPERENDVVVLDVYDRNYPPPLNPLAGNNKDLQAILNRLYGSSWSETRASDWLNIALHTLNRYEGATIQDIKRVIEDVGFRQSILQKMATDEDKRTQLSE